MAKGGNKPANFIISCLGVRIDLVLVDGDGERVDAHGCRDLGLVVALLSLELVPNLNMLKVSRRRANTNGC